MSNEQVCKIAFCSFIFFALTVFGLWLSAIWSTNYTGQLVWTGIVFIIPAVVSLIIAAVAGEDM